ncbi:MAG: AAA family ATPase [Parabacteroides sp.]|nr:AAA family ATPase [Parabacteroides sp.]
MKHNHLLGGAPVNRNAICHLSFYSDITASDVQWLWYPYIPLGKITLIQGDPGDGKTTLMLHIASLLSQGAHMPFSDSAVPPSSTIYQSAEDSPSDTIKPRLLRESASCDRIAFLESMDTPLMLKSHEWENAINQISARLLVIDPLQAFLGSDTQLRQAIDMRLVLRHLSEVAERTNCAIVLVGHMNKAYGGKSLYRGLGSIDIVAAARSVLLIGRLKDDQSVRVLAQIKNSLAKEGSTLAFEMTEDQGLRWIGEYDMTADDILYGTEYPESTKHDAACNELKRLLASGSLPCNEIYGALEANGISKRTIDQAKKTLSIASTKKTNEWYWSLTEKS